MSGMQTILGGNKTFFVMNAFVKGKRYFCGNKGFHLNEK